MNKSTIFKKVIAGSLMALAMSPMATLAAETLKWGHVYEASTPYHEAAKYSAKKFEEYTDGRYKINVFPASSLGKENALNEGLALGTVDIIYTGVSFLKNSYAPITISNHPFVLKDFNHWKSYVKSDLFKELASGYGKVSGNEIMSMVYYGQRQVTSNFPILKPSDMKDLKIRVPNAPVFLLFPRAVGANPTPLAFSEVYLALQQGVVDAQENPLPTIKFKKFHEVQTNINLTGHITDSLTMIVSGNTLRKMSATDKTLLSKALNEGASMATAEIRKQEKNLVEWFRGEGVTVNVVDRKPFIKAVAPYYRKAKDLPFTYKTYIRFMKTAKK